MRKTKIVADCRPRFTLRRKAAALVEAGVDVFRLNMSHGDHAGHQEVIDLIRQISLERSLSTAILADLQGPKIRLGTFRGGEPVQICKPISDSCSQPANVEGTAEMASISYKASAAGGQAPASASWLTMALIELRVEAVTPTEVVTRAILRRNSQRSKGRELSRFPIVCARRHR